MKSVAVVLKVNKLSNIEKVAHRLLFQVVKFKKLLEEANDGKFQSNRGH